MIDSRQIETIRNSGAPKDVIEVYEYLHRYMIAPERKTWKDNRKKNWEAIGENVFYTEQEENDLVKIGAPASVFNECNKGVQASAAVVTASKPGIEVRPRKGGSAYLSELIKRGVDVVWDQNQGSDMLFNAVEESKISGLGTLDTYFNRNKGLWGKICIEDMDPENVYFDRDAKKPDYSDTHIIKAILRDREYIKDRYGDQVEDSDLSFGRGLIGADQGEKSSGLTGGDSYTMDDTDTNDTSAGKGLILPKNIWEIEAMLLKTVDEFIATITIEGKPPVVKRYRRGEYTKEKMVEALQAEHAEIAMQAAAEGVQPAINVDLIETKVEIRVHRLIVGKKQIGKDEENPYGEDPDGDPVMKLNILGHSRTKSAYPTCPTTFALPINRSLNKAVSQWHYTTSVLNNPPTKETAGKVKWEGARGAPGSRAIIEMGGDISHLSDAVTNTGDFVQHIQTAKQAIQDQFDTPDVMRGRMPANEKVAHQTVAYLQDTAGVMSTPYIRKLEGFVGRVGRTIVSAMIRYWKRHQWEALIDETDWREWLPPEERAKMPEGETVNEQYVRKQWTDAIDRVCPIEGERDIDIMDFDIKVMAGSTQPTNRMAKTAEAREEMQMGLMDPETYWETKDSTIKDKVVPRLKAQQQKQIEMAAAGVKGGGQ